MKEETKEKELDDLVIDFFPKSGRWSNHCFGIPKPLHEGNLPCHLRDEKWLASFLIEKYHLSIERTNEIRQYVRTSEFFKNKRNEYEQRIVKWQIAWMMHGGDGWIVDNRYGGEFYAFSNECDYAFRKGVVDTLSAIGMYQEAIEEGIEKNTDLWQETMMMIAFKNEFNPTLFGYEPLPPPEEEFQKQWLRYRKYQYYQQHKKSVDQYSMPTSEMLLTKEEVKSLFLELSKKEKDRHQEIEEYKNTSNFNFEFSIQMAPMPSFKDQNRVSFKQLIKQKFQRK